MSSSSTYQQAIFLPESVENAINEICQLQSQPPLKNFYRRLLSEIGEQASIKILKKISSQKIYKSFDGFISTIVKQEYPDQAAAALFQYNSQFLSPTSTTVINSPQKQNSVSTQSPLSSLHKNSSPSNFQNSVTKKIRRKLPFEDEIQERRSPSIRNKSQLSNGEFKEATTCPTISEQLMILSGLEHRKLFLVLSYIGRQKLEAVMNLNGAHDILSKKDLPMARFEVDIWNTYGHKYCEISDRSEYLDWESGKTHLYYCHVHQDGTYHLKGPILNSTKTHLQRSLGDDNILIVKFSDDVTNGLDNISKEGILVGLKRYQFFVFKDERKRRKKTQTEMRKKDTYSSVKCYFVHIDNYGFSGKSISQSRCRFMHIHTISTVEKYMARFSLILSKTIKLHVDFRAVKVERIEDIPFRDENGCIILDEDGKPLLHTDGTGYISEDLAMRCPKDFSAAMYIRDNSFEKHQESARVKNNEPPLLMQCRLFHNGCAVKGTFLINKKLDQGTIQIRPSMIKVDIDPALSEEQTFNSLEVVAVSNRPGRTSLSKNLIALLSYGNVPPEFFLDLLAKALEDTRNVYSNKRAALRVASNNEGLEYGLMAQKMILSGIPLNEPYLQFCLSYLEKDQKSKLREGKIPIAESFYLMGTADPTGILNYDEVCVILENGQISGQVLVYRNPGLHFGDVHVMNAIYVKEIEDFVGNAKYGIFFSTKGARSAAYEMATGDFDGDMYWISRNPELLKHFNASEPWRPVYSSPNSKTINPQDFSSLELEYKLFQLFLEAKKPSFIMATACECWLSFMDRLLTIRDHRAYAKDSLKIKMIQLIDIYYDALDAPKSGKKVNFPEKLKAEMYPHYMGKKSSFTYHSSSILGQIYDKMEDFKNEAVPNKEIWKLECFDCQTPDIYCTWKASYDNYRSDMTKALNCSSESANDAANEVMKKYQKLLYDAPSMEESNKNSEQTRDEAVAIYHVTYDYAISRGDVKKCGFAWKIAGSALCDLFARKNGGMKKPLMISSSVLRDILN